MKITKPQRNSLNSVAKTEKAIGLRTVRSMSADEEQTNCGMPWQKNTGIISNGIRPAMKMASAGIKERWNLMRKRITTQGI